MSRFKPGQSGNPAGRPKGVGWRLKYRRLLEEGAPEVIAALLEKAKDGHVDAIRAVLERLVPPLKSESALVELPLTGNPAEQLEQILSATTAGRIPASVADALANLVTTRAQLADLAELQARVEELESSRAKK